MVLAWVRGSSLCKQHSWSIPGAVHTYSLLNELKYFGIYRDDGLGIFEGNKSTVEVNDWLNKFQSSINHQATNDFLQFMAEVWKPGEHNMENVGKTSVNNCDYFPFLDMEMHWGANLELTFNVHIKPNQEIKYLNDGSSHTPGCFKAITTGVCYRLTMLTSINDNNGNKKLDELYPLHFKALSKANLLGKTEIPTLKEKKALINESKNDTISVELKKWQKRDRKRAIYFKIGFTDYWRKPIHKMISEIKAGFPTLKWL